MAVGPSASAASSTAATSTNGSTTSTVSSSSGGGGGSPSFSANGTAALILAFLAIGLFVGGMVAMIGLRRRALGRAHRWMTMEGPSPVWAHDYPETEGGGEQDRARRKKRDVGTPPKLYDIYVPAEGIKPVSWHTILPLSARTISPTMPSAPTAGSEDIAQAAHRRWRFNARRPFRWTPGPTPTSPPTSVPQAQGPIEVAVVISMPTPVDVAPIGLDYTLGLTQLSWSHDPTEPDKTLYRLWNRQIPVFHTT